MTDRTMLKKCPFCGRKAKVTKELLIHFGYASGFRAKVQCYYCKVKMDNGRLLLVRKPNESEEENIKRNTKIMDMHLEAAVECWNTRSK